MRTLVNPRLTDALIRDLVRIWVEVTNEGGAVGFTPPVDTELVGTAVAGFWDQVLGGDADLVVVVDDGGDPLGFGFLVLASDRAVSPHRAEIQKLMRAPAARGTGVGVAVLAGLEARARERGLRLVTLNVRGGTGREEFYRDRGYQLVAELPDWLEIGGAPTPLLVMDKPLDRPGGDRAIGATAIAGGADGVTMHIRRLDPDLPLPTYAEHGDAGMDLMARVDMVLPAGTRAVMPTGVAVAVPQGHVGLVHPRSGLAVRKGLSIVNTPGTIDAGYRGELKVPLINLDPSATIRISRGDRIAQLLVQQVERVVLREVDELPEGVRGERGFGSTGA